MAKHRGKKKKLKTVAVVGTVAVLTYAGYLLFSK